MQFWRMHTDLQAAGINCLTYGSFFIFISLTGQLIQNGSFTHNPRNSSGVAQREMIWASAKS